MSDEIQQKYCFEHKIPLTFSLNVKIPLKKSPRRSLVVNTKCRSFSVRYDNFPKAITNPDRHLFAKSTFAEDVDIHE